MIGSGIASATWGHHLGREALKGITQPDTRPVSNLSDGQGRPIRRENLTLLKEEDILASVKARIDGGAKPANTEAAAQPTTTPASPQTPKASPTASPVATPQLGFPIVSRDRAISFQVDSVKQQDTAVVLQVSMRNNGSEPVQFLYSSMNITNDEGRLLTGTTRGLPDELPPNGQAFSGTVTVPLELLDDAGSLSLNLTDYPAQQVQLELTGIPVER
jgi:hypothetical protein